MRAIEIAQQRGHTIKVRLRGLYSLLDFGKI